MGKKNHHQGKFICPHCGYENATIGIGLAKIFCTGYFDNRGMFHIVEIDRHKDIKISSYYCESCEKTYKAPRRLIPENESPDFIVDSIREGYAASIEENEIQR